jgi:hypothetical protein
VGGNRQMKREIIKRRSKVNTVHDTGHIFGGGGMM